MGVDRSIPIGTRVRVVSDYFDAELRSKVGRVAEPPAGAASAIVIHPGKSRDNASSYWVEFEPSPEIGSIDGAAFERKEIELIRVQIK